MQKRANNVDLSYRCIIYCRGLQPTTHGLDAARQGISPSPRPFIVIRSAIFLLFSMIDMLHKTAEMIFISWQKPFFVVFTIDSSEKRPECLAKIFFFFFLILVFAVNSAEKKPEFLAKSFFFLVFAISSA